MKFVVFADDNYNYRKPMADGLYRHLTRLGHEVTLIYEGKYWLCKFPLMKVFFSDIYKIFQNIKAGRKLHLTRFISMLTFQSKYKKKILDSDCLIVVDNCPNVFFRNYICRLEELRKIYKGPIVNYDLHYLPNQGWYGMILEKDKNNYGLDRFDWYLPASLVTEFAIPKEIPQIYNCIGFDLKSPELYPEQSEFMCLIDFPHKGFEKERELQIEALERTNTKYVCLTGKYTRSEIRSLYRKTNIFFTSVRESFSMPVLEIQLCGGKVATPYASWLPAHFLNKSIYETGVGELGSNFIVYNNNIEELVSYIESLKIHFSPSQNIANFMKEYPNYFDISDDELVRFCNSIKNGSINNQNHKKFADYNKYISKTDKIIM